MTEKYLIVGLMVTVAALLLVVINLVVGIKQSRARLRQCQKERQQPTV